MSDSDYEPAIDMPETPEPRDAADDVPDDANDAPADAQPRIAANPPPVEPQSAYRQRVVSDKVKEMARAIAKQASTDGFADDLVPVEHTDPPPAAAGAADAGAAPVASPAAPPPPAVAAAAHAPPVPSPVAAPPAPSAPQHDVARAAAEQAKLVHELREKQIAEREAALAAREKQLPSRADLIEKPGATLTAYLRDVYGITDDAELKDVITDLVTDLSENALGVKLPPEVKTATETRKAVRSVKAYKADLARETQRIAEERAAAEKAATEARAAQEQAAAEQRAVAHVTAHVASMAAQTPFLHSQENPAGIVVEVIREQLKRGQEADLAAAVKLAEDYYRSEAEATVKRAAHLQSLLAPAAPAAPAKAVASPGAAPGPAATPQPKPTTAPTTPDDEDSRQPMDRHERRALRAREMFRKHMKPGANA